MIRTIIYQEFLANIITFRFLLSFLICIGLVGVSTYVLMHDYEDRLQSYQLAVDAHTDEIRGIQVYSELSYRHRPKVDRKPRLMSVLNEGVEGRLGNTVEVSHNYIPVRAKQHGSDNPYLVVFRRMDLTLVFQIVLSLMALLFAYDTIVGAREDGTLPLTLSNAVSRGVLLLGKYLGGMLSLVMPVIVSMLVVAQVILLSPHATIRAPDWARLGLFLAVSLVYVSVFFTLGMLFSSQSRRSATALMLALFFWVVFVLVWPIASVFAVSKLVPLRSDADLSEEGFWALYARVGWEEASSRHRLADLWGNQYQREMDDFARKHNIAQPFDFHGSTYSDFYGQTLIGEFGGLAEELPLFHEYQRFAEELRVDYADKQWQMWQEYLNQNPIRQAKLAETVSRISPAVSYAHATAILAETDLDSHFRFLQQARQYREELVRHLRSQNAFGSGVWYNPEAGERIVKGSLPVFRERPASLLSSIGGATLDVLVLVLLNVAFFLLTYVFFLRYNVK